MLNYQAVLKKLLVVSTVCLLPYLVVAQSDGNYDYHREFIWGINKNTSGGLIGGFVFKWSKALGDRQLRTIGWEMVNVKNPDEIKINTGFGQFIPYKTNYLYAFRVQYGRDHILFMKTPSKGVQINFNYAGGPTIGIIAPYYVDNGKDRFQFVDGVDQQSIIGTGYPFQGLFKSTMTAGLNLKASLSFEMGAFKSNVTGFEVGTLVDMYPNEIELMTNGDRNAKFFPTLFITIFYGKRR